MEREVARAKVNANRVATVVANEWKDANDKVMPVKQWLEERKFFQACCFTESVTSYFFKFPCPMFAKERSSPIISFLCNQGCIYSKF